MRPKLNKIHWKVVHISINIERTIISEVSAASKKSMTQEEFFNRVVDYLNANGFIPRRPIADMKKTLHSPFSESEYYTFLKSDDSSRLKVVLDIRISEHYEKEYGTHTARDRHIHYMDTVVVPAIEKEQNIKRDASTSIDYFNVSEHSSDFMDLIDIDGKLFNSYDDALVEMKNKIDNLG